MRIIKLWKKITKWAEKDRYYKAIENWARWKRFQLRERIDDGGGIVK